MKVRELIVLLLEHDMDADVHLDADISHELNDRMVRHVAGVRVQDGYRAVAIDASQENV